MATSTDTGFDAYSLFRELCKTMHIRQDATDRDRPLYEALCTSLGMVGQKPKAFFESHPSVTPQNVIEAFFNIMSPFAAMVGDIYKSLSDQWQIASGGKQLRFQYDFEKSKLEFNAEAFRQFERKRDAARKSVRSLRYNDDAVGGLRILSELAAGNISRYGTMTIPSRSMKDILNDLAQIVWAHKRALTRIPAQTAMNGKQLMAALRELGFEFNIAHDMSPNQFVQWRQSVDDATMALPRIDAPALAQWLGDRAGPVSGYLDWLCRLLRTEPNLTDLNAITEFLQLPYWPARWQVYEVWCFSSLLALPGGWTFTLQSDGDGVLQLGSGLTHQPRATLAVGGGTVLELWTQYGGLASHLRADIAVVARSGSKATTLGIVECKQHLNPSESLLTADAKKYAVALAPTSEVLLVNYDALKGSLAGGSSETLGGVTIRYRELVRPGVDQEETFRNFSKRVMGRYCVALHMAVDITKSMENSLTAVASAAESIVRSMEAARIVRFSGMLFAGHAHGTQPVMETSLSWNDFASHIRSSPTVEGTGDEAAVEDALAALVEQCQALANVQHVAIFFVDAPPYQASRCTMGHDFRKCLGALPHNVKLLVVNCGPSDFSKLGWSEAIEGGTVVGVELGDTVRMEAALALVASP